MAGFAKLIELLEKHRRTVDENEDLYKILTTSPFFESLLHNLPLSDDEMLKVCSHLKLERAESGTMVAKQNTKANLKLYFILEGTVSIFRIDPSVPQSLAEFTNNELLEMYKYEKLLTNSQPLKQRGTMVYSFNDPMMISIKEQYENEQKNIVQGSIGERTLQSSLRTIDNRRRSRVTSISEQVQTAPKTSEDQLKLIHSQFAEGNYLQATFNTVNSMLASLKKAIRFNVLLPMSELFQRFCRKYLGRVVRELGPGSSFGERALQGETLRSASVITTTPCIFIYLEAGEYNAFVKASATARTVEKIQLIYNSFQGSEKMDNEDFWQFQFLFDRGSEKENRILVDDTLPTNRVMLILRGSCEVYKIKTKQTLEEFDRVVKNLDEDVRNHPEVYSLLLELRDYFAAMPEGHKYLLGFIGEGQLINIEGLFSHEGASFFSYKVRSPKFEYFNLIKSYLKKYIRGPVGTNLINNLITILKYRNQYIKNKNYILNSQENVDLVDGSLSKLASTKKIKQMLVNDTREELIDCPLGGTNKRDRLAEISMQYFKIPTVIRPEIKQQIREQIRINQKKRAEERDGIDKGKIRKAGGIRWIRGAKNLITGVEKEEEEIARGKVGSPLSTGARHFETSRASLGLGSSKQHIMSILQKHCEFDLQPNRTSNPVMITKPESQARFSLKTFSHKESTSRKNTMPNELSVGKLPTLYEHSHGKAVKSLEKTSHSKLSISNLPRSPHRPIITGSSENIARPPKPKRFSHHYQTEVDIKPMKGLESTRAAQNGDQLKLYLKTPIYSELFRQQYLHS